MCEFCLDPNSGTNRDQFHPSFAGFFSADAIEAAVRQANANQQQRPSIQANQHDGEDDEDGDGGGDDDSDGT